MKLIEFDDIQDWHIRGLAASLLVAPVDVRHSERDMILALRSGAIRLFEADEGCFLAVHKEDNRLIIDAMLCKVWSRNDLVVAVKQLATEFACDKLQTTVFDRRLADAIIKIGGKIESYDMTLDVEAVE